MPGLSNAAAASENGWIGMSNKTSIDLLHESWNREFADGIKGNNPYVEAFIYASAITLVGLAICEAIDLAARRLIAARRTDYVDGMFE